MTAGQPLRGFVGQKMNGKKSYRDATLANIGIADVTSGSGSITATRPCTALIYAWGAGGSAGSSGIASAGGNGAAALYKRVRLSLGQTISYSVGAPGATNTITTNGNPGGDTTVTLPNGKVLTAQGGPSNAGAVPGAVAVATGGDINRSGGVGGTPGNAGSAGDSGGAGGAGAAGGGGGGGAGFSEISGLPGGAGSAASASATAAGGTYGGGSGASQGGAASGAGGVGRVLIMLVRAY